MTQVIALFLAVFSLYVLKTAWRKKERNRILLALAWLSCFSSIFFWSLSTSIEKATAIAITIWVLLALMFLLICALQSPFRTKIAKTKKKRDAAPTLSGKVIMKRFWIFLLIGPFSGVIALVYCTALFLHLDTWGMHHTSNITLSVFVLPLLWALTAFVMSRQDKAIKKTLLLVLFGGFASALLALALYLPQ